MKYVIVDDEINASNLLKRILERYEKLLPEDEIHVFNDSVEAYGFICRSKPDLIFLDIEMPRMTGEELAKRILAELVPKPFIIFITAFPQYSMFAWDAGAVGYILKPYSAKSVYDAIEKYNKLSVVNAGSTKNISDRPFIRCFPDFELFVSGQPVFFKNKKSRELLALLVHNRG